MSAPDVDVAQVHRWVDERNQRFASHLDEVRIEVDTGPASLTIVECRAPWRDDAGPDWSRQGIARLRYRSTEQVWHRYWSDRHGKYHRYEDAPATATIDDLLAEIDADPTGIFWG